MAPPPFARPHPVCSEEGLTGHLRHWQGGDRVDQQTLLFCAIVVIDRPLFRPAAGVRVELRLPDARHAAITPKRTAVVLSAGVQMRSGV
ncbi:hypothetical protein SGLAM104S_05098 [Streptomyces glaucescens]